MTDLRAKAVRVRLEIWVPYPEEVRAEREQDIATANEVLAIIPFWCRPVGPCLVVENPKATAFEDSIQPTAIRDEFRRKAKKLGLQVPEGDFSYEIEHHKSGLTFSVWVRE